MHQYFVQGRMRKYGEGQVLKFDMLEPREMLEHVVNHDFPERCVLNAITHFGSQAVDIG